VNCDGCGAVYSWDGTVDIPQAECAACKKTFNSEFGYAMF